MSYRPPSTGRGYVPPAGSPGPYNNVPGPRTRRKKPGIPWLAGCSLILLGMFVGILGFVLFLLFLFGTPASNQPLPGSSRPGTSDAAVTLSDGFINASLNRYLKTNPVSLGGIVNLKEVVLRLQPNQRAEVALRVGNSLLDFDITVVEALAVQQGKVVLTPIGSPKVGNGSLPIGVDKVVALANSTLVEPQLNAQIAEVQVSGQTFKLADVATSTGTLTVKYNAK